MAENSSQEALIANFISITGADKERAVFFLQSAAWNLEVSSDCFSIVLCHSVVYVECHGGLL